MKIGIPVRCQNGHKSTWLIEISGLEAVSMGTFGDPNRCKCPKHEIGQGYFADGKPFVVDQTDAARDVLAERQRQMDVEGWTPEHDGGHDAGELAAAGSASALYAADELNPHSQGDGDYGRELPAMWPWESKWWKPTDPRRALVKAGALILAEIERIDRQAAQGVQQ